MQRLAHLSLRSQPKPASFQLIKPWHLSSSLHTDFGAYRGVVQVLQLWSPPLFLLRPLQGVASVENMTYSGLAHGLIYMPR